MGHKFHPDLVLHSDGMLRTAAGHYAGPIPYRTFLSVDEVKDWLDQEDLPGDVRLEVGPVPTAASPSA